MLREKRGCPSEHFDDAASAAGQSRFMSARLKKSGLAILIGKASQRLLPGDALGHQHNCKTTALAWPEKTRAGLFSVQSVKRLPIYFRNSPT
jgi:hypothetical protein